MPRRLSKKIVIYLYAKTEAQFEPLKVAGHFFGSSRVCLIMFFITASFGKEYITLFL